MNKEQIRDMTRQVMIVQQQQICKHNAHIERSHVRKMLYLCFRMPWIIKKRQLNAGEIP